MLLLTMSGVPPRRRVMVSRAVFAEARMSAELLGVGRIVLKIRDER